MGSVKFIIYSRFIAIVMIQITALSIGAWYYFNTDLKSQLFQENRVALTSINKNVHYFYQHQVNELTEISKMEGFHPFQKKLAKKQIETYLNIRKMISSVHYYNAKGYLEFAAKQKQVPAYTPEHYYKDHRSKRYQVFFEDVLKNKRPMFSSPLYTKSGVFYHVGLIPVLNQNQQLQGILSFGLFPEVIAFNDPFSGLAMYAKNILGLTDQEGNVIAANNISRDSLSNVMKDYVVSKKLGQNANQNKFTQIEYSIDGEDYFFLSQQVEKLPFYAVLGINKQVLKQKQDKFLRFLWQLIIWSLVIGLLCTILISRQILKGVDYLFNAVAKLKQGYFKKDQSIKVTQDFDEVLDQLDDLSKQINKGKLLGNLWGQEDISKYDHFK